MYQEYPDKQDTGDNTQGPVFKLGEHVISALDRHVRQHESEAPKAERLKRLEALRALLEPLLGLRLEKESSRYHIQTLDTGTNIAASVEAHEVRSTVAGLTNPSGDDHESIADSYLKDGPYSKLDNLDGVVSDVREGLRIMLSFETPHSYGDGKTASKVCAGVVLDPESIVITGLNEDGSDKIDVIGPDDERFEPIMDVLKTVVAGVAGEKG